MILRAGRIDTTMHPFATSLGPFDQRITTRYNVERFEVSLYGVMHETGHALYEQGLRADRVGLPSGDAVSLGIHESQSRLWENHVGRTPQFWQSLACAQPANIYRTLPAIRRQISPTASNASPLLLSVSRRTK